MILVLIAFFVGVAAGAMLTWHFAEVKALRDKAAELAQLRGER